MREIDAKQYERDYAESKFPEYHEWLDLEARNVFHEGIGAGTLKCISGFNHYGDRDKAMNNNLTSNRCPIITCAVIKPMRIAHMQSLKSDMQKVKNCIHIEEPVNLMLTDIENYLQGGEPTDGCTTQSIIGMNALFRGWITMNWLDAGMPQPRKMHTLNKIIVKHSVRFYSQAWKHRNEAKHDPSKFKEFVCEWCEKVADMVKDDNKPELSKYARTQEINAENCYAAHVVSWIKGTLEFKKKAKREAANDIRGYFPVV